MALTYEKITSVMSQPPDRRKDFEVSNLLPWFKKKSDLFKSLKHDILFDVIKYCQFVKKPKDEVIIRQGEQGDCMYILMQGKVTIYIQYSNKGEDEDKPPAPPVKKEGESERSTLGTFVVSLGQGATFGEVALLSDDCIRTASIITDETTDFIVMDRELYNRSVKDVLKKEFADKSNFVASNPFFQNWSPKYKKQLTMALQKEYYPYDGQLTRQGDHLSAMYFMLSGEVKIVVDPAQHKVQYPKVFQQEGSILENGLPHEKEYEEEEAEELMKAIAGDNQYSATRHRRSEKKRSPQEVCFLGLNECIGDMEVLLDLDTYMQTAICTQRTEVLVLELKHWERLLIKRNPRTIESMKDELDLRLMSRIKSKHVEKTVPLFTQLLHGKVKEYLEHKKLQNEARNSDRYEKHTRGTKTVAETFKDFIPTQGALIDIGGEGTVFHYIREREKRRKKKPKPKFTTGGPGFAAFAATQMAKDQSQGVPPPHYQPNPAGAYGATSSRDSIDYQTSDPVLSNLEDRMRNWLSNDGSRSPGKVFQLQRSKTETHKSNGYR